MYCTLSDTLDTNILCGICIFIHTYIHTYRERLCVASCLRWALGCTVKRGGHRTTTQLVRQR